jgi:hypothetical protein
VREAEKVEGLRCGPTTLPILARKAAKPDQACLFGMQFQTKARKAFAQLDQEPLGLEPMLEPYDKSSGGGESHPSALTGRVEDWRAGVG